MTFSGSAGCRSRVDPGGDLLFAGLDRCQHGRDRSDVFGAGVPTVFLRATAITPGLESPTIAPLADPDWVAVRALVPRRDVNAIMDDLARIGAKAILASDVRFCRF